MKTSHLTLALLLGLLVTNPAPAELADPTAPASRTGNPHPYGSGATAGWELHSTLVNTERRIAVINGQAVQEGDRIGTARVARIRASEVLLDTPERSIRLRLLPNSLANPRPRVTP
jgi:hypothetical protein